MSHPETRCEATESWPGRGDGHDTRIGANVCVPPPCGGPNAGDLHFDEAEQWIDDPAASGFLLRQVAIHEIGHLLGLSHSQEVGAIMFRFYSPDRIHLADDDIAGIRELYGAPTQSQQLILTATASGSAVASIAFVRRLKNTCCI